VFNPISGTTLVLSTLAISLTASVAQAAPMPVHLRNSSFDVPTPGTAVGDNSDTPAVCGGATGLNSASESWTTWINTALTQVSSWISTTPDGNYTANLVFAGGAGDGLVQVLSQSPTQWVPVPMFTVTDVNSAGVWVWVVEGEVLIQFGNGGQAGGPLHTSQTTGQWEWIGGCGRADGFNNEVTIYATGPSIFYADDAAVWHEPACDGEL